MLMDMYGLDRINFDKIKSLVEKVAEERGICRKCKASEMRMAEWVRDHPSEEPPVSFNDEGDPDFEIEKILGDRVIDGEIFYLVKFKGYEYNPSELYSENDVSGGGTAVSQYMRTKNRALKRKIGHLKKQIGLLNK